MKKDTDYYIFNYCEEDADLIDELEEYLNSKQDEIFNFWGSDIPKEKVEINIIPTKEEYDYIAKTYRKVDEIPKWSIGFSHDDKIEYVSLHDYKNTAHAFEKDRYLENLDYYKKTIVHEYVHFVAGLYRKKHNISYPAKYLNEGIATYLSGQKENVEIPFNYSLEDILNSNNSYNSWYLLTKYIIEGYGKDYFLELFGNKELAFSEAPRLFLEAKDYYKEKIGKSR